MDGVGHRAATMTIMPNPTESSGMEETSDAVSDARPSGSGAARRRRRGPRTPGARWTAIISAVVVLVCVLALILVPVPFVARGPGQTVDLLSSDSHGKPLVDVQGLQTRSSKGHLRMTTVSVTRADSSLSLGEALVSHWLGNHDVLAREAVYPSGKSADEINHDESLMMDTSQRDAVVAALRAAGQPVTEMPMVSAVSVAGPSNGKLQPGDLIEKVDGHVVTSLADVGKVIRTHAVGDTVNFQVLRGSQSTTVAVTTVSSVSDRRVPAVGITVDTGYRYAPTITYGIPVDIVGPSAGLMMALATYELVAPTDLLGNLSVAGTGAISPDGNVGAIGGIREKIAGAERDGAQIFLTPASNCRDVAGVRTSMTLVKVSSLKDAIAAIQKIRAGGTGVPHC